MPLTVLKTFKEFVYSFTKLIACDHEQMNPSNVFKCIKIDSGGSYFQFISIRNCTEMIVKLPTFFGKTRIQHESFKEEECIDNQMQELSEIISRSNIHDLIYTDSLVQVHKKKTYSWFEEVIGRDLGCVISAVLFSTQMKYMNTAVELCHIALFCLI